MKKLLALALTAAMSFSLVACGSGASSGSDTTSTSSSTTDTSTDSTAAGKSVCNVGMAQDVATLAPYGADTNPNLVIRPEIYQYLFNYPQFGGDVSTLEGEIGKSYEVSEDGLTVTVQIYDYVKDSAGNAITADDVIFSYDEAKKVGEISQAGYVDSIEASDDYTLVFHLTEASRYRTEEVLTSVFIVDSTAYNPDTFATAPIGTGPYVVTDFVASSHVTVEKNANYWQTDATLNASADAQNVDVINFKLYTEDAQRAIALQTGDIDLSVATATTDLPNFVNDDGSAVDGYTIDAAQSTLLNLDIFNCSANSNVSDVNLRKAICYALDTTAFAQGIFGTYGTALKTYGSQAYSDYQSEWDKVDYYEYNLDKAKEFLANSNYVANGSPELRILYNNTDKFKKCAELTQAYLNAVGINVQLVGSDDALFQTEVGAFDDWDIQITNQGNPYIVTLWHQFLGEGKYVFNDVNVNECGVADDALQSLLDQAAVVTGDNTETMTAVNDYIRENAMIYGLFCGYDYQLAQKGITGIYRDNKQYVKVGACTFADDYQSTAGL